MKKYISRTTKIIILCLSIILGTINISTSVLALEKNNDGKKVILIDPGHGGIDGGAKSQSGCDEKNINLQISLKLKDLLENQGYKVYLTRATDVGLYSEGKTVKEKKREDLEKRVKMKTETNCDVFISIHQNKFSQTKYKGAQVWYSSLDKENNKSRILAESLQQTLKEEIDQKNNRVAKPACDQYKILRDKYEGASVIVECGFLSNEEEAKLLQDEGYQEKLSNAILHGLDNYFKNITM